MAKSKNKKSSQKPASLPQHLADDDNQAPAVSADQNDGDPQPPPSSPPGTTVNPEDEWPDTRREKAKKKAGIQAQHTPLADHPASATTDDPTDTAPETSFTSDLVANPEDEWPEEQPKSRNKKSKTKQTQSKLIEPVAPIDVPVDTVEPTVTEVTTLTVNPEDEWPEQQPRKVKAKNKNKAKPAPHTDIANEPAPNSPVDLPDASDNSNLASDGMTVLAVDPDDEWPETRKAKPKNKAKQKKPPQVDSPATPNLTISSDPSSHDNIDPPTPSAKPDTPDDDLKRPLSKKEKEKLRIKRQKELEKQKQLDASKLLAEETAVSAPSASAGTNKKNKNKGKPGAPPIAALQKMIAAQRAAEEEAARIAEEERIKYELEQQQLAEQEKIREEARQLKKEKERLKKEQLRKEGKLLTKSQKQAQQRAALKLQQLIDAGMITPKKAAADDAPKERIVYGVKKKHQTRPASESAKNGDAIRSKKSQKQMDKSVVAVASPVVDEKADESELEDGVKSSWDMTSSDDDEDSNVKNSNDGPVKDAEGEASSADDSDSNSEDSNDESSGSDESDAETEQDRKRREAEEAKRRDAISKRKTRMTAALAARSKDDLRSPICCILGHVDTGKTKLLDKIRQTNVQEGEAGGITQQIGATYFPQDAIEKKISVLSKPDVVKVPGLLVIDTPGHESFTNLRSRGSSLCNIAILVVDIMHGLEPQTIESLNLLRLRKTPFIVALNKIDRIYGWKPIPNHGFEHCFANQADFVQKEFHDRLERTKLAFSEQGLNSEVYYKNQNMAKYVSLVPTSAITGEGIPDLLYLLCHLTQTRMSEKLMFVGELEATVLEVKVVEGLGTTIDVILSNGVLHENDRIVVCGLDGPIVTNVRALLTPQPLRELRVKSQYVHHKSIKAAMGIKISAHGLDKAVAGSRLLVVTENESNGDSYELEESILKEEVMQDIANLQANIDKSGKGVWVQASTLGSLEALLSFLKDSKIPVSGINIGPVHKKDVVKASVMLDRAKEYAVMLCFDVKIDKDAQEMAEDVGVKVFSADIIYHLFDQFKAYHQDLVDQKRQESAPVAVFPCILSIISGCVFNKRDPIILGVDVKEGVLKLGTPICVFGPPVEATGVGEDPVPAPIVKLGKVTSIEMNHKPIESARKSQYGGGVAIKIECANYETPKMVGRHFLESEDLMAMVSRESIDCLKENFRNDMSKEDWALVIKLKKRLNIP